MRLKSIVKVVLITISIAVFIIGVSIVNVEAQLQAEEPGESDELKVLIKEIVFEGNTVIDTPTLEKVTEPYRDRELTLGEMSELVDLVTITYQEQGYILARAYLPKQDIKDGLLKIGIVEGSIGKIIIAGKTHYSDKVLKRYFKPQVKHGVIKEEFIEKGLLMSTGIPQVKTNVALKKGDKPGLVDVVLNTTDTSDVTFGVNLNLDYNNYGSDFVSEHRFNAVIDIIDHKWGSVASLRGSTGANINDTVFGSINLMIPVNSYGTKFSVSFLQSTYSIGEEFAELGLGGDSTLYGFSLSHPLIIKKNRNLNVSLGYDNKRVKNEISGSGIINIDRIDEFNLSLNYDDLDRFLGKNIISLGLYSGQIIDFDEGRLSRLEANKSFERVKLSAARIQKVPGTQYANLLIRGAGQYSNDRLLPMEQAVIGGYGSVRGTEPSGALGDYGYNASIELMMAPPFIAEKTYFGQRVAQMAQFSLFVDHGGVYTTKPVEGEFFSEHLTGYGAGVRLFYKDKFNFKYDIGLPYAKTEDTKSLYHYFAVSVKAF